MLSVYRCNQEAVVPTYATQKSACFDLHACVPLGTKVKAYVLSVNVDSVVFDSQKVLETIQFPDFFGGTTEEGVGIEIPPHARVLIPTGLKFNIPEGHSLRIHPRSGLSFKNGIALANCEGVVDEDYVDEVFVSVLNTSSNIFYVEHKMRIAQAELVKDSRVSLSETLIEPTKKSDRSGGFGSTGV